MNSLSRFTDMLLEYYTSIASKLDKYDLTSYSFTTSIKGYNKFFSIRIPPYGVVIEKIHELNTYIFHVNYSKQRMLANLHLVLNFPKIDTRKITLSITKYYGKVKESQYKPIAKTFIDTLSEVKDLLLENLKLLKASEVNSSIHIGSTLPVRTITKIISFHRTYGFYVYTEQTHVYPTRFVIDPTSIKIYFRDINLLRSNISDEKVYVMVDNKLDINEVSKEIDLLFKTPYLVLMFVDELLKLYKV